MKLQEQEIKELSKNELEYRLLLIEAKYLESNKHLATVLLYLSEHSLEFENLEPLSILNSIVEKKFNLEEQHKIVCKCLN